MNAQQHLNLQRQLAEMEALQSIFSGEGEFKMGAQERAALEILSELKEDVPVPDSLSISFAINLTYNEAGGQQFSAHFSLPKEYPEKS
eukprot:c24055_g2_i1 orf=216-479(+)